MERFKEENLGRNALLIEDREKILRAELESNIPASYHTTIISCVDANNETPSPWREI